MKRNLKYSYILLTVFSLCIMTLNSQVININTENSSLVYHVVKNKVYQFHYGKKLDLLNGVEKMNPFFNEIYPSFGNGSSDEVAIILTEKEERLISITFKDHRISSPRAILFLKSTCKLTVGKPHFCWRCISRKL